MSYVLITCPSVSLYCIGWFANIAGAMNAQVSFSLFVVALIFIQNPIYHILMSFYSDYCFAGDLPGIYGRLGYLPMYNFVEENVCLFSDNPPLYMNCGKYNQYKATNNYNRVVNLCRKYCRFVQKLQPDFSN